ncbi:hypothetical protein HMPREF1624_06553 [Sporothrix schenckii ATCC 58251]|uniref:PHD-type domain-containing protein n=1 Tax=Sporothrix schenckii (strain ATCC 58251 / de Perez 2211183) TaxID=1391915 RepID=U7PNR0_SPOS1|nr:hypothetical protein HMPREF1624_06553 [Sporothrix schenckii ATCC 58251]
MSGDQATTSFGDSTAQPPTPKQTPTSATSFFSSPVFETPKAGAVADLANDNNSSHTETTTPGPDWTPRFAEDFSVFNNTPGNLRGSQGPFSDFVAPFASPTVEQAQLHTSSLLAASNHHKRPLSIGSIATEIHTKSHVHRLSIASSTTSNLSNPSLPLPPVDPSKQLSSSPGPLVLAAFGSIAEDDREIAAGREFSPDYYGDDQPPPAAANSATIEGPVPIATRSQKKARGDTTASTSASKGQTATPPPSARKGGRRIAPKLKSPAASATTTMQNDQGYGPQHQAPPNDFLNTPQQQQMATFMASPTDLFGYPMSAPAASTAFADAQSFWAGGDPTMSNMDVDFAAGAHAFGSPASIQRQLESMDWAQANQANQTSQAYMVAGAEAMAKQHQHQHQQHQQHQHQHQQHMHHTSMGSESDPKGMLQPTPLDTTSVDHQGLYAGSYPTPVDDPFGIVSPNGGVNPGLLFTRPPSSSMDLMASAPPGAGATMALADATNFDPTQHQQQPFPRSSAPGVLPVSQSSPPQAMLNTGPASVQRQELRRSSSAKEIAPRRKAGDRPSASSPVKSVGNGRPGLSRSHSENRGPRLRGRASLPVLAPALKTSATTSALPQGSVGAPFSSPGTGLGITRSASFGGHGGGRPTGRSSPIRMHHQQRQQQQQQHNLQQQQLDDTHLPRLSSLTSIPEGNTPQSRASVKFTIDANGRARVETAAADRDGPTPSATLRRNQSARSLQGKSRWDSSSEDDSSSTDDEPIIIPSRTTSFALPDPVKPTIGRGPLHSSQRSVSDRSTTSSSATMPGDAAYNDPESEAETVMNDLPKGAGDAASELEKLRQMRQKRASFAGASSSNSHSAGGGGLTGSGSANNLFGSVQRGLKFGGPIGGNAGFSSGRHHNMQAVSPTTLTDASLPTPSSARSQAHDSHGIRCICGRQDAPPNSDGFIVQCESCDLWLHGRCINITKRTLPPVYICAFCANTPNVRNIRIPPTAGSSPLAHKSFKTFR